MEEFKENIEKIYSDDKSTFEEIADTLKELSAARKAVELFWKQRVEYFFSRKAIEIPKISMR